MTAQVAFCCGVSTAVGYTIHAVLLCLCGRRRLVCAPEPQNSQARQHHTCCVLGSDTGRVCGAAEAAEAAGAVFGCVLVRSSAVSALAAVRSHLFAALQQCPCPAPCFGPAHSPAPYLPQRRVVLSAHTCGCWQHLACASCPAQDCPWPAEKLRIWSGAGCRRVLFLRASQCAPGLGLSAAAGGLAAATRVRLLIVCAAQGVLCVYVALGRKAWWWLPGCCVVCLVGRLVAARWCPELYFIWAGGG
jgi:hypothetical protein